MKNSKNPTAKTQSDEEMGKWFELKFFKRRHVAKNHMQNAQHH
jgi:hypothetical protein